MSRTTIIAVFAVFFLPVIIAVLLHSDWFQWRPAETRNHGELIQPPHALPDFRVQTIAGTPVERDDLLDQWQLIHVNDGPCETACLEALYWLRQVRRAQDRHQTAVDITLVTPDSLSAETLDGIEQLEAGIRVVAADAGRQFLGYLPDGPAGPVSYILDPQANIILRYPDGSDFNGMRRDLRRLLTWTRTDQPPPTRQQPDS
jgi:hypothetical protein